MRKLYGWLMAWSLYWIGDLVSRPMCRWETCAHAYPIYNWLMLKSADYQEDYDIAGPWGKDIDGDLLVACLEKEEEDAKP